MVKWVNLTEKWANKWKIRFDAKRNTISPRFYRTPKVRLKSNQWEKKESKTKGGGTKVNWLEEALFDLLTRFWVIRPTHSWDLKAMKFEKGGGEWVEFPSPIRQGIPSLLSPPPSFSHCCSPSLLLLIYSAIYRIPLYSFRIISFASFSRVPTFSAKSVFYSSHGNKFFYTREREESVGNAMNVWPLRRKDALCVFRFPLRFIVMIFSLTKQCFCRH